LNLFSAVKTSNLSNW